MQPDDAVHLGGEALVVGGDQRGAAFAAHQVQELGEDGVGGVLVEIAGRLVGEHQRRLVGERAGDRDALLLAARQLGRAMLEPLAKAERAEQLLGALTGRLRLGAADELREDDIFGRVELGQQVVELVDEAEQVAAKPRAALVVELAASSPCSRIEPSNPPSSRPTA